jgi:RsiW-degrading membrane proteinase PrsW (M82 family)
MTAIDPDLLAARTEAIEQSGWGRRFNPIQPRNVAFWTYLLVVGYGALVLWQQLGATANAYQDALVLSIVVSVIVTFVFGWFLNRLDRFATAPTLLRIVAFGWGAVGAIGMAIYGNNAILTLWSKGKGQVFAAHWAAALTAPFVEEPAKGAGMLLLIALAPRLVRSPFDGFILGSFIGLGFQVVEDVSYAVNSAASAFGANQLANGGKTLGIRIATAIPSHWMYSGIFCTGLVWLVGRPDSPPRRALGLILMLTAMLLHGLWDGIAGFASLSTALGIVMPFLVGIALILVYVATYKTSVKTERNWMQELLAPEVQTGVIYPAELEVVAASRHHRKAYVKSIKGRQARRSAEHVIEATTDLGLQLARDHGEDTPTVHHLRSEVVRLRQS